MSIDLIVKQGDTRDWAITLSDASGTALDLTSARVKFQLRPFEWSTKTFFVRDTAGTNSDYIAIGTPNSDGGVTITPTTADWTAISDNFGVYRGDFWVLDDNADVIITKDVLVELQESMV